MDDESPPGVERLDELFRAHAATILSYARARLPQEAEDVVSETFAVAWRRIDDIPDPALPWLLKTARNKVGDRLRAARRFSGLITRLEVTTGWHRDPTQRLGERQLVQRALDRLRPADRDVVELLVAADLTNAELASVLGCSEDAAYARCSRARKRLRAALAAEEAGVSTRPPATATTKAPTAAPAVTIE